MTVTLDGNQVATAVTYKLTQQKAKLPAPAARHPHADRITVRFGRNRAAWFGAPPRRHRHHQNGTGM